MPEYLAPGVYVEEVDTGSKPIEGVSTSTAGMLGMTERGQTDGLPVLVTSFADFRRKFGGFFDFAPTIIGHNYLPYAVDGFFRNGGKRVYIKRVSATGAVKSTKTAQGGLVTRLKKDMSTTDLNIVMLKTLRGIDINVQLRFTQVKNGEVTGPETKDIVGYDRKKREVELASTLSIPFEERYTFVEVVNHARANTFIINAKDEGSWGDRIDIRVEHEAGAGSEIDSFISGAPDDNQIKLASTSGFYVQAWVEIDPGETKLRRKITKIDGLVITLDGPALTANDVNPQGSTTSTFVSTCEFSLSVSYKGISEEFSGLTLEKVPGRYFEEIINHKSQGSKLIHISLPSGATDPVIGGTDPLCFPSGDNGLNIVLEAGSDGSSGPTDDDYHGADNGPGRRTGIEAFKDIDQVSIIVVPGITSQAVQEALINHCELLKDRFAILDPDNTNRSLQDIQEQRQLYDTKYAAIYYPRIKVRDPITKKDIAIPPSGHMAGIYARSDIERGVHKAPANEVIRGITGLEQTINKGEQDILNPKPNHINVLRDFRKSGRGYRVWGARCITSDSDWKYINVRRLFIFVEESIDEGTQWVVFEPNDEPTWARVRRSVRNFLTNVWRDGALQGATPEEAFFVTCDRTTMTQTDIDNGKLIMLIGIAPVKPAEFVIFRIGQWSGGSEVEEV